MSWHMMMFSFPLIRQRPCMHPCLAPVPHLLLYLTSFESGICVCCASRGAPCTVHRARSSSQTRSQPALVVLHSIVMVAVETHGSGAAVAAAARARAVCEIAARRSSLWPPLDSVACARRACSWIFWHEEIKSLSTHSCSQTSIAPRDAHAHETNDLAAPNQLPLRCPPYNLRPPTFAHACPPPRRSECS